jgi:putative transposase
MPRTPRGETSGRIFHAINRGVERRDIFLKAEDYGFFLTQAKLHFSQAGIALLSYCLMPNHYHFLTAVTGDLFSRTMQALQSTYSMYFNRVYERVGHLFQDRFKSFEVTDDEYLEWLPVYIHRNPVKAGLVSKPGLWEWSGHGELLSGSTRHLDLSKLAGFGFDADSFRASYRAQSEEFDRPLEADATLPAILRWCAKQCGVRWQDVESGGRGGPFTRAKLMVLEQAAMRGYTPADVARLLGCTPAALFNLRADAEYRKGTELFS